MNLLRETQTLPHTHICTKKVGEPVNNNFFKYVPSQDDITMMK